MTSEIQCCYYNKKIKDFVNCEMRFSFEIVCEDKNKELEINKYFKGDNIIDENDEEDSVFDTSFIECLKSKIKETISEFNDENLDIVPSILLFNCRKEDILGQNFNSSSNDNLYLLPSDYLINYPNRDLVKKKQRFFNINSIVESLDKINWDLKKLRNLNCITPINFYKLSDYDVDILSIYNNTHSIHMIHPSLIKFVIIKKLIQENYEQLSLDKVFYNKLHTKYLSLSNKLDFRQIDGDLKQYLYMGQIKEYFDLYKEFDSFLQKRKSYFFEDFTKLLDDDEYKIVQ